MYSVILHGGGTTNNNYWSCRELWFPLVIIVYLYIKHNKPLGMMAYDNQLEQLV